MPTQPIYHIVTPLHGPTRETQVWVVAVRQADAPTVKSLIEQESAFQPAELANRLNLLLRKKIRSSKQGGLDSCKFNSTDADLIRVCVALRAIKVTEAQPVAGRPLEEKAHAEQRKIDDAIDLLAEALPKRVDGLDATLRNPSPRQVKLREAMIGALGPIMEIRKLRPKELDRQVTLWHSDLYLILTRMARLFEDRGLKIPALYHTDTNTSPALKLVYELLQEVGSKGFKEAAVEAQIKKLRKQDGGLSGCPEGVTAIQCAELGGWAYFPTIK